MPSGPKRQPRPDLTPVDPAAAARGGVVRTPAELGAAVAWLRSTQGLTLERAAGLAGVTKQALLGVEHASRGVRHPDVLTILAALGYDLVLVPRDPARSLHPDDPA